jgi:hypothetical protein
MVIKAQEGCLSKLVTLCLEIFCDVIFYSKAGAGLFFRTLSLPKKPGLFDSSQKVFRQTGE